MQGEAIAADAATSSDATADPVFLIKPQASGRSSYALRAPRVIRWRATAFPHYMYSDLPVKWRRPMLEMRSNCECCDRDLAPDDAASICSLECTFCQACAGQLSACPNCGGELVRRPRRSAKLLGQYPASTRRRQLVPCFG